MRADLLELPVDTVDTGDFTEWALERGWGDGLPLVPPTPERVEEHLAYCPWDPDESVGTVPPANREAEYRVIAANTVMAGCRPRFFPVVVEAVRALLEPAFNLYGLQATTNPGGPMVLVGGPVAEEIGCNGAGNVFGQGWAANATIGRAVRLVLNNIGGGKPQSVDRATHGFPGKYTMCGAENERESPWPPFHADRGVDASASAVTVFSVQGFHNIIDLTSGTARDLLLSLSAGMSAWGTNDMTHGGTPFLVLSPEHAAIVAGNGWSRDDVRRFLFEHARFDLRRLPEKCQELMATRRPKWIDPARYPLADSPEDIHVLVAGGPGIHALYLPSFGASAVITRALAGPDGEPVRSIEDFARR